MAGNYQEYITKIFLNDSEAESKLEKLRAKIKKLKADKEQALNDNDMTAFRKAEKDIKSCEKEMDALSTTAQRVDKVLSNLSTSSPKEINNTIKAINRELRSGSVERGTKTWQVLTEQLKRCKTELKSIEEESKAVEKKGFFGSVADILNKNWGAITQFIGGVTQLSMTIRESTKAYTEMDTAMSNVRKYTGQTVTQVERMNEDFKKIDTRTGRDELNALAGAAGRLGITATDDIEEFVDAADMIGVALGDDLGDGAVDQVGKLAMAFGEDDKLGLRGAMLATGSAVNELAQNSSASAGYLVDFTARLAGVGVQAGLTQAQIMGFGSVLDENMQRDEMASTALSQIITKMVTDTATMAKFAGQNVKEFSDLVKTDMNKALITFFQAMNEKGGFQALAPMFADMGLDGQRATSVLSVLATKIADVTKNQRLATQAYVEGTSVIDEFNVQNSTVEAEIDKQKKVFKELTIQLGQQLLPVVKYTISTGSLLVKSLYSIITFVKENKGIVAGLIVTLTILNTKKLLNIASDKLWAAGTFVVDKGLKALWLTLTKNPLGIVAASVGILVGWFVQWRDRQQELKEKAEELNRVEEEADEKYYESEARIRALDKVMRDEKISIDKRREALNQLKQIIPEYNGMLDEEGRLTRDNKQAIDDYLVSLRKEIRLKAYRDKLEDLYKRRSDLEDKQTSANDALYKEKYNTNHPLPSQEGLMIKVMRLFGDTEEQKLQRAVDGVNEDITDTDSKINAILQKIKDAGGEIDAIGHGSNNHQGTGGNGHGSGGSGYVSEKQRKAEEKLRKKAESDKKKKELAELQRKKDADKAEQADYNTRLVKQADRYAQGLDTYTTFLKKREQLQLDSLARRKAIWGEDSNEAKQLEDDELRAKEKYLDATKKLQEDEIENQRIATAAKLNEQFYNKDSEIYMNEAALNEALYENDMSALADRIAMENEGSEEWLQLKAEMEQKELDHQMQQQQDYHQKLSQMREEWGKKDYSEQQIAINGLEDLHTKGLVSEEEYQEMKLQIIKHYAALQAETDAEERGPGSNAAKFNEGVTTILNQAKAKAGDAGNLETDSAMDAMFANDFKNWQNVNAQIQLMEQQGVISHAQANAAKAKNDIDYLNTLKGRTQLVYSSISTILSAASSYSQACSDLETAKITANYDKQIEAAGNNSKKKERLEKQRDKKIAEAKTKANKKAMKMEIAQAIAETAMGAIAAYTSTMEGAPYPANLVLAPISAGIAIAAGMLQIATIKKQHQAQAMGYYEGGFTSGSHYRREAGVVHEGEFVANHLAVNNPSILPALQLIDQAQRNNTVSSLTGEEVSRAVGGGSATVVSPVVNVQQDTAQQQRLQQSIDDMNRATGELRQILADGIVAYAEIDGEHGVKHQLDKYNTLTKNK